MGSLNATTTEYYAKVTRRRSSIITSKHGISEDFPEMESPKKGKKRCRRNTQAPLLSKATLQARKKERTKNIYLCRPTYAMMKEKLQRKWKKEKFEKFPQNNQDNSVIDQKIDVEVATRSSEGVECWEKLTRDMGEKNQYDIDYIICLTCRKLGEAISEQVLIKWSGFPCPTWESRWTLTAGKELYLFETRQESLDFIEHNLRSQLGDDEYERKFPFRYLEYECGRGNDGYVENKKAIYKNVLRSIEWRWNYVNGISGQPLIYIEDWTDEPEDSESLMDITFSNYLTNSKEVEKILKHHNKQLDYKKCGGGDCSTCLVQRKVGHKDTHCCGMSYSVAVGKNGKVIWDDKTGARTHTVYMDCTPECLCGPKCRNRSMTNGRQHVLCVFREIGKGWGVRTVDELPNAAFVTEYAGEMYLDDLPQSDRKWIYDFHLPFDVTDAKGKKLCDPLTISAANKGNESRFFNHSCSPNMQVDTFIVERHGIWYNHMGFCTKKKIQAGEELTFDYFQDDSDGSSIRQMFGVCSCGSKKCRASTPDETNEEVIDDENEDEEEEEKSLAGSRVSSPTRKKWRNTEMKKELNEEDSEEEMTENEMNDEESIEEDENKQPTRDLPSPSRSRSRSP